MNKKCLECVTYRATEGQCDEYTQCPHAKYGGYQGQEKPKRTRYTVNTHSPTHRVYQR